LHQTKADTPKTINRRSTGENPKGEQGKAVA